MSPLLLGAEQTRETFAGLDTWQIALWYGLIALSVGIFGYGVARLALKYRRGRTRGPAVTNALWFGSHVTGASRSRSRSAAAPTVK